MAGAAGGGAQRGAAGGGGRRRGGGGGGGVVAAAVVAWQRCTVKIRLRQVLEAEGLVPALREDIEGDLPADGVGQLVVGELLPQLGDHRLAHLVAWW